MGGYITAILEHINKEGNIYASLSGKIITDTGSVQLIRIGRCSGPDLYAKQKYAERAINNCVWYQNWGSDSDPRRSYHMKHVSNFHASTFFGFGSELTSRIVCWRHNPLITRMDSSRPSEEQYAKYLDQDRATSRRRSWWNDSEREELKVGFVALFGYCVSHDTSHNYFETALAHCLSKLISENESTDKVILVGFYTMGCREEPFNKVWAWLQDNNINTIHDYVKFVAELGDSTKYFNSKLYTA